MEIKIKIVLIIFLALQGCAAKKTAMDETTYNKMADLYIALKYCNENGFISPSVAASGTNMLDDNLMMKYDYNPSLLQSTIKNRENSTIAEIDASTEKKKTAGCNNLAMHVEGAKQRIEHQRQQELQQRIEYEHVRPKQTYCNPVGSQIVCNSY